MKLKLFLVCLSIILFSRIVAQETEQLSKVFIGFNVTSGFFGNSIESSSISTNSTHPIVRSTTLIGNSNGGVFNARLIFGYRISDAMSIDLRFGVGAFGSSSESSYSSSETYTNIGTYRANDTYIMSFSGFNFESSFKHKIAELKMKKRRRFFNARFGLGFLSNSNEGSISYNEHSWPIVGFVTDNDDSPVVYEETKLVEVSTFPFTKYGIDYETRGRNGFTFAFDLYWYLPNLFGDNSVILQENPSSSRATNIYASDNIFAYTLSVSFLINRLFVTEAK